MKQQTVPVVEEQPADGQPAEKQPAPPPRRLRTLLRPRFGLATLLGLVTLVSILLGYQTYRARQQCEAVEVLTKGNQINIRYDFQLDANGDEIRHATPGVPQWLLDAFGVDFFYNVREAVVVETKDDGVLLTPEIFQSLGQLKNMEGLRVVYGELTTQKLNDLCRADSLKYLQFWYVDFAEGIDFASLAELNLEHLGLRYCVGMPGAKIQEFHGLPIKNLNIGGTLDTAQLCNLVKGLPQLETLHVEGATSYRELAKALSESRHLQKLYLGDTRTPVNAEDVVAFTTLPDVQELGLNLSRCDFEVLRPLNEMKSLKTLRVTFDYGLDTKKLIAQVRAMLPDKTVELR